MAFLPIYVYFIALSLVVSIVVFNSFHRGDSYLKNFPPFLAATLIIETYGSYLSYHNENNVDLYNFFTVIEFCFYQLLISMMIKNKRMRKVIWFSCILYAVIAAINIIFFQGKYSFHTITYSLGCLIIVSYCVYYFFELFRFPKSVKLVQTPAFWICSSLLFYYCCSFPLFAFVNYWGTIKWVVESFDSIVTILNIFLYSLFTIAFLCSRTRKYTLSSS